MFSLDSTFAKLWVFFAPLIDCGRGRQRQSRSSHRRSDASESDAAAAERAEQRERGTTSDLSVQDRRPSRDDENG